MTRRRHYELRRTTRPRKRAREARDASSWREGHAESGTKSTTRRRVSEDAAPANPRRATAKLHHRNGFLDVPKTPPRVVPHACWWVSNVDVPFSQETARLGRSRRSTRNAGPFRSSRDISQPENQAPVTRARHPCRTSYVVFPLCLHRCGWRGTKCVFLLRPIIRRGHRAGQSVNRRARLLIKTRTWTRPLHVLHTAHYIQSSYTTPEKIT